MQSKPRAWRRQKYRGRASLIGVQQREAAKSGHRAIHETRAAMRCANPPADGQSARIAQAPQDPVKRLGDKAWQKKPFPFLGPTPPRRRDIAEKNIAFHET